MKSKILASFTLVLMVASGSAQSAVITLFDWALNIDGVITTSADPLPSSVNAAGFDFTTGLGNLSVTHGGVGTHTVDLFVDHEIDSAVNLWFNEVGSITSAPAAGQTWEIDEPGFVFGDIYDNLLVSSLDNSIGEIGPEDVSMAIGWDFSLTSLDTAVLDFSVSEIMPVSGFFLTQGDPDSQADIYFASNLDVRTANPIPEPATLLLVGLGLLGLRAARRNARSNY